MVADPESIMQFNADGYTVVRELVAGELLKVAYCYASLKADLGAFDSPSGDVQVPSSPAQYGDPLMEVLLARCAPKLGSAVGLRLLPTYSYCRVLGTGSSLARHTDRASCELTATVSLGYEGDEPSPLFLNGRRGGLKCVMYPGDAIIYRGCEIEHWREVWHGRRQAQVFLHYVDADGPNRHLVFDRRQALGLPPN